MHCYIRDSINQHGEAEVTKPFQYDLKVTVEELMEKHNVSDKNLFGGELSEIMKLPAVRFILYLCCTFWWFKKEASTSIIR